MVLAGCSAPAFLAGVRASTLPWASPDLTYPCAAAQVAPSKILELIYTVCCQTKPYNGWRWERHEREIQRERYEREIQRGIQSQSLPLLGLMERVLAQRRWWMGHVGTVALEHSYSSRWTRWLHPKRVPFEGLISCVWERGLANNLYWKVAWYQTRWTSGVWIQQLKVIPLWNLLWWETKIWIHLFWTAISLCFLNVCFMAIIHIVVELGMVL